MAHSLSFDHLIIAVRDLDAATANFQALGFTAYYGGKHTHKTTHNALISLADGTYLELLAPVDPARPDPTLDLLDFGEGFNGYALLSHDLAADAARLRESGLAFSGPNGGHRTRYDGERVAWQTLNFDAQPRTPFLIADETPHEVRVSDEPEKIQHANGVTGVDGLVVAVHDLQTATNRYTAILGQEPTARAQASAGQTVSFTLANCTLTLAQPRAQADPLVAHLTERGEMLSQVHLRTTDPTRSGRLDSSRSHGAHIELVAATG